MKLPLVSIITPSYQQDQFASKQWLSQYFNYIVSQDPEKLWQHLTQERK